MKAFVLGTYPFFFLLSLVEAYLVLEIKIMTANACLLYIIHVIWAITWLHPRRLYQYFGRYEN